MTLVPDFGKIPEFSRSFHLESVSKSQISFKHFDRRGGVLLRHQSTTCGSEDELSWVGIKQLQLNSLLTAILNIYS